jgi:thiamine-phosphate pyrophosphorylase
VGIEGLRAARAATRKPLVAIGGITLESAREVYRAGADSLAVASDLLRAKNPGARAEEYLAIAAEAIGAPR